MKKIKQKIAGIHCLLNDLSSSSTRHHYGLYTFFLLDALATLLNLGVLYGIFYLYLQDRINFLLCLVGVVFSVLFKLWVAYIKIHRQTTIVEQLNTVISEKAFIRVLMKKGEDYQQSAFSVEQLSGRINRCLMSYFDLFANFSLFLLVFVLLLFKAVLIFTLIGYILLAVIIFRWLNQKKEKTENLLDSYRFKKRRFINDVVQMKDTLMGIGTIGMLPEAFARVNRKQFRLQRWLREIGLRKSAVLELFTISYLIACFLLWTFLYDKEQVLSLLAIMVLLTAQLFPKAIKVLSHYHEMQDNFSFVEQYFELKNQTAEKTYQERGTLHYDEQSFAINELTLRYDERQLFDRASLKLPACGHFILKAPNGAGKSTLLKWIVAKMADTAHKAYYIPQQLPIYRGTILENIKLFSGHYDAGKIEQALKTSGFDVVMQRKNYTLSSVIQYRELSGGEKTKLVLASLLYHRELAVVILIDEVTASLDSESTQYFYHVLAKTMADKLIIEITHETHYCDNPQYIEIVDKQLKHKMSDV